MDAAHRKRTEAIRIAGGKDAVPRHHDDGESARHLAQRVADGLDERLAVEWAINCTMISESLVVWK